MTLITTVKDITTHVTPLGFTVEEDIIDDDIASLIIEHPNHDGANFMVTIDGDRLTEVKMSAGFQMEVDVDDEDFADFVPRSTIPVEDIATLNDFVTAMESAVAA